MRFAKYWERAGANDGFTAWGWSDESREEARRSARERLERMRAAFAAGRKPDRYAYEAHPIRELQLESLGSEEAPFPIVTGNA